MSWTKQILRLLVVMLLQVLLFNQLQLWGLCHPYIFILFLLLMPITLPEHVDMIIGACVGLLMDVSCNSPGVHMAACTLLMFIKRYVIGIFVNDRDRLNEEISSKTLSMAAMLKYCAIMVLVYHLVVFSLAAWSWSHIGLVLQETLVSSVVAFAIIATYNILKDR